MFNFDKRSTSKKSNKALRNSNRQSQCNYESLEPRAMLATTFAFQNGLLTVQLNNSGDQVEIFTTSQDVVEVNGEQVIAGGNPLDAGQVRNIAIIGNGRSGQDVNLDGQFNYGALRNVSIEDVSGVSINGVYQLSEDFLVNVQNAEQNFIQFSSDTELRVKGRTEIVYSGFDVILGNDASNFVGEVSVEARNVIITDQNALRLGNIDAQNMGVKATNILQQANSSIDVETFAYLDATNVSLPNELNDFAAVQFEVRGNVLLHDSNELEISGESDVEGRLTINATGNVSTLSRNEYKFNGDFSDSQDDGPDLTPINGTLVGNQFEFGRYEGLVLSGLVDNRDYFVEFDVNIVFGQNFWNKIVDFKDRASGFGIYIAGNKLRFLGAGPNGFGSLPVQSGVNHTIAVQRSAGLVSVFLDGQLDFAFHDTEEVAVATNQSLHLFVDDTTTFHEGSVGTINNLRVNYEGMLVVGDLNVSTNGNILFNSNYNRFVGEVSLSGKDIEVNAVELSTQNIAATRNLKMNSSGNLIQAGGRFDVSRDTSFSALGVVRANSAGNQFDGLVNLAGANTVLIARNDLTLGHVDVEHLRVVATGRIDNADTTSLVVKGIADFDATQISLGVSDFDFLSFNLINLSSTGLSELHHNRATRLGTVIANSLILTSTSNIRDVSNGHIEVTNNSRFFADSSITLGDESNDIVRLGKVIFQTPKDVFITTNGNLQFHGNSTMRFLTASADGNVTDSSTSKLDVEFRANLQGDRVILGDKSTDRFNAGSISFDAQTLSISEDSSMLLTSVSSVGLNATLRASSSILDTRNSFLSVARNLNLNGESVLLGDGLAARLQANTFSVSGGNMKLLADSPFVFAGSSNVASLDLYSSQEIANTSGASVNVDSVAKFSAPTISLGSEPSDQVSVGRLTFESTGRVVVETDSELILAGNNSAKSLRLESTHAIKDVANNTLNVTNHARFVAASVQIGDRSTDQFNAGTVSFDSNGFVDLSEDSSSRLAGQSNARTLRMTSTGDIEDNATARTVIQDRAVFTGVDLIIGELEDDCFDVLAGEAELLTFGSGAVDVRLGC